MSTNNPIHDATKNLEQWVSTTSFTKDDLQEASDRLAKLLKKEELAVNVLRKLLSERTEKLANDVNAIVDKDL
jgi:ABC-type transporter Mla subunit MlaD